jgi:hypothetical protein
MTPQTDKSAVTAPEIAPLRTLAVLGDEGTGRCTKTDLTPRSSFPVHPDWYERYWYGDQSPSRWGVLVNTVWRLCSGMPRVAETIRRVSARTIQWPRSVHT